MPDQPAHGTRDDLLAYKIDTLTATLTRVENGLLQITEDHEDRLRFVERLLAEINVKLAGWTIAVTVLNSLLALLIVRWGA